MSRAPGVVLLAALTIAAQAPPAITASSYLEHIKVLADDDLGGRGNGTSGLERAADYIAAQFKSAGLQPGGDSGGYGQPFDIQVRVEPPRTAALHLTSPAGTDVLALGRAFYPLSIISRPQASEPPRFDGVPVVFAGYGIAATGLGYDDFAGIDVTGAAVAVLTHEPQENDATSVFDGRNLTPAASVAAKAREVSRRGARMLIVIEDPSHAEDRAMHGAWWNDPQSEDLGIPVLRVARDRFGRAAGLNVEAVARGIDTSFQPGSRALPGLSVSYTEHRAELHAKVRNVVGIVPGAHRTRSHQAVVVGAHYDHVGTGGLRSEAPAATGEIHNGADDNASGVSALIEIARLVSASRGRFPRTVVFAAFAAEEEGLLGSQFYVDHPAVPLADTTTMVNLDMVGRPRGRVMVGIFTRPGRPMSGLVTLMRPWTRLAIADFSNGGYQSGASDEGSFAKRGVTAIALFTGFHDDYHRPSDDWNRIDAEGGAEVARLAFRLVEHLARQP